MQIETWLTFITVVFVFAIIPGPTVILVMGQAISYGRKSVTPLVAGVNGTANEMNSLIKINF
jgi:threonine/homoserine/homoserine lactone efflux protein